MMTQFSINGKAYSVNLASLPGDITLNSFIRDYAGLAATKFMCQEGGCGVCVCVVSSKHPATGETKTRAVNSCLTLLNSCTDWEITTCEGIGNKRDGYHPIQKRLAKMNGTQCGYCSPGFVMNMYGLLAERQGKVTMEEVENAFGGNICRCTGYRPILDAMKSFAVDSNIEVPEECRDIEDLSKWTCPKTGLSCKGSCKSARATLTCGNGEQWFWPQSLQDLFALVSQFNDDNYMLVSGNTAHGVYRRSAEIDKFVDMHSIPELHEYKVSAESLVLGGNLSLSEAMEAFKQASQLAGFEYCSKVWNHFDLIANVPVRNMGTLAGNLALKHQYTDFPSDIYVVFDALDVQVVVQKSIFQEKSMSLSEYLQTSMSKAIIKSFILKPYDNQKYIFESYKLHGPRPLELCPLHESKQFTVQQQFNDGLTDLHFCEKGVKTSTKVYQETILEAAVQPLNHSLAQKGRGLIGQCDLRRIMPRAQNAHAYVNAAFLVQIQKPDNVVKSARISYGGLNPGFSRAKQLEQCLVNKALFAATTVRAAFDVMKGEIKANVVVPEPSPEYRIQLAHGLFYKFLLAHAPSDKVATEFSSGGNILKRPVSTAKQTFDVNDSCFPLKKPTEKHEGLLQCSGEALFSNDILPQSQQLWAAFFTAKKIGAKVVRIDTKEALKLPGVVAVFTAKDVPGNNCISIKDNMFFMEDEALFVEGEVKHYGQPVGIVVAESNALANKAAGLVELAYEGGAKEVFPSLKDVLNGGPSNRIQHKIKSQASEEGTSKQVQETSAEPFDVSAKGALDMGLQYHYFMEPHTTVAIPTEGGLQLYVATQYMDLTQTIISQLLGLKNNEVQVRTQRVGGGYGGKATRSNFVACSAALAAYKLNRPVRFVQSLESMMDSFGKRWPCHVDYSIYARESGKIVKLISSFFEDAGCTPNESPMGHTVLLSKNCYEFTTENYILDGYLVLTDSPSNIACRAPGSVEGIAMIENIMEHTAFLLGKDPLDQRLANLIAGHKISQMIPRFIDSTQYKKRREDIVDFNKKNRWVKRGLGLAIMEYHVGYFGQFPATVAIYHGDGTVVISHGGIEMGQGMNTKIAQVAAHTLGIPLELIRVDSSNTINGANAMVTGGSIGSETVCFAVRKCCNTLLDRLAPVREEVKDPSWHNIINEAHSRNTNLIVSDGCQKGEMDPYTVCGLGLTEVEVDILTGNYLVKRVDIVQDAGESLNPNVDIGQVEGAFIMGLGYWTSELCVTDKSTGQLKTNRTWNYKPPGAKDIPIDFRIQLLAQSPNPAGFMRSKATGEPSICLAVNVAFALQQALQSARDDAGLKKQWVELNAPMTPEYILLNSGTQVQMMNLTTKP